MLSSTSTFSILDLIVLIAGLYMLYAVYLMLAKGELKEGVMINKSDTKKCKDIAGFSRMMKWPSICLSIVAIASGAAGLYQDYTNAIPSAIYWGLHGIFIVVIIWFVVANQKAQRTFF